MKIVLSWSPNCYPHYDSIGGFHEVLNSFKKGFLSRFVIEKPITVQLGNYVSLEKNPSRQQWLSKDLLYALHR